MKKVLVFVCALTIQAAVQLQWDYVNPPGATVTFRIYRSTCKNTQTAPTPTLIGSSVVPIYRDSVTPGTSYCYQISSVTTTESPRSAKLFVKNPK